MSRMLRTTPLRSNYRAVLLAALIAVIVAVAPVAAFAKSYSMPKVSIQAEVQPNGDLDVAETRTFSFDGDYTQVFWSFETAQTQGYEIIGVKQTAPVQRELTRTDDSNAMETRPDGTYFVQESGDTIEVHAFHRTADADATFELTYRAKGGAKRYSDTGELYWQAVGPNWDVGVGDVAVTIDPPTQLTKADVKAWAHGPLTGVVAIQNDGVVTLNVSDLPPNTFVEARALYPASALPEAPLIDQPRRQSVLDEEAKLANEANAERTRARIFVWGGTALSGIIALTGLFFVGRAFLRHGREHKPEFQGQYYREDPRPDLHPAIVGALWRFGKVEDTDIAATLMELADKGVVKMVPVTQRKDGISGMFGGEEQSFELVRVPGMEAKTTDLDRQLLDLLFGSVAGGADRFVLADMKDYAKAHPQSFTSDIKAWKDAASAQAEMLGFFDSHSKSWQVATFVIAAFMAALGVFGAIFTSVPWPACILVPTAVALAVMGVYMSRRTREGNELYRTYVAVRDFLKDFSRLKEAPPSSIILWNRFLVLAVIFGIAEEVIEQLRVKLPDVVRDPGFQTSYWWVYAGAYGHSPVSEVSRSFVSAGQVASSQMSSASGGGGGFSGGGGGGFGGGGGGAS